MDDFEARLKGLRLSEPSHELDERVRSLKSEHAAPGPQRRSWQVPLWAATAVSLAMGLAGLGLGLALRGSPRAAYPGESPPASVQVIYHSPSTGTPFDFTRYTRTSSALFPPGAKITVRATKGTQT